MQKHKKGYALPSLKQFFSLLVLMISFTSASAQDSARVKSKSESIPLSKMTSYGKKVCVLANHNYTKEHAIRYLEEWGYWKVVKNREDADFILQIVSDPILVSEHKAYAVFNDPISGKARYRTSTVNTIGSISYHGRKAVVRRLITLIRDTIEESEGKSKNMH